MQTSDVRPIAATRWTATEREDFFAAIARHRRASWQVTLAAAAATAIVAVVVAVLISPLFYCLAGVTLDLVNRLRPMPDLLGAVIRSVLPVLDSPGSVPLSRWLELTLLAAAPGLVFMALAVLALGRLLRNAAWFAGGEVAGRAADRSRLEEQRFADTVEEMCIAAQLPAPRILVLDAAGANAAVFGRDERHATIVVGAPLLSALNRAQCEGVAGHLVGAMANGDLAIGLRTATTLSLFGLLSRLSGVLSDRQPLARLAGLLAALLAPQSAAAQRLGVELAEPFGESREATGGDPAKPTTDGRRRWRDWLALPLGGPVMIAGFFSGLVAALLLAPVIALAWRERKYLADATAVRLTRDPDGIAEALQALERHGGGGIANWASHLAVVPGAGGRPLGGSMVPMFPATARRERALAALGAHVTPGRIGFPWPVRLLLAALFAVIGPLLGLVVYLLLLVSVAMSGMFLLVPAAILHALLR